MFSEIGYIHPQNSQLLEDPFVIEKNTVLLKDIVSQWFKMITPQLKESTISKYYIMTILYILPFLGNTEIEKLKKHDVQQFTQRLLQSGSKNGYSLSPKTVLDILSLLRNILQYAEESGYHCSPGICTVKIHQKSKKLRILSKDEQCKLNTYLLQSCDYKDKGILLCLFTGLRIGEICALTWDDISLERKTIRITKTLQRIKNIPSDNNLSAKTKVIISTPKSSSSNRTIPLPDAIIPMLQDIQSQEGFFLTGEPDHFVEPRSMQYHFKKILKNCDLPEMNFHVLRHTFATRCIELGFDVKTLSELLGHTNVNITMNRYVHPSFELKKQSMQRLSELFFSI